MFALLRRFLEFVRQHNKEPETDSLFLSANWSVGTFIDLFTDVLGWINGNLNDLKEQGAIEVNVIRGDAFSRFIIENQRRHKYLKLSNKDIEAISYGVILVATDGYGCLITD